jgi:hypothetical protein
VRYVTPVGGEKNSPVTYRHPVASHQENDAISSLRCLRASAQFVRHEQIRRTPHNPMTSRIRYLLILLVAGVGALAANAGLRSAGAPAERTYIGTGACAGCHADQYSDDSDYRGFAPFQQTMHQMIHRRPTPESMVIDKYFRGDSVLRAYQARVAIPGKDTLLIYLSMSPDRKDYYVQLKMSDGGDTTPPMRVAYTYGGNGWIQRYLLEVGDNFYVAPFQYVLPGYRRRVDSGGAFYFLDVNRWLAVVPETGEAEIFDFNTNRFRSEAWDKNCASCHVTGPNVQMRVAGTDTSWTNAWVGRAEGDSARTDENIRVGCESCHGPGSEHVANPTKENIIAPSQWASTKEGTDLKLDLCGSCHYRAKSKGGSFNFPYDEETGANYVPGVSIKGYIKDMFTGMNTWPDRVTSYAHHQSGQDYLHSKMYSEHVFENGCWDCHSVHSTTSLPYQLKTDFYSMKAGEGCLKCHQEKARTEVVAGKSFNKHTKHPQSMSQCINCHMTKTASIGFMDIPGNQFMEFSKRLYEFSNHGFNVIPPSATRQYASSGINIGMMNTCAESCHRNGRGSRNSNDSIPAAPYWGVWDNTYGIWNEKTDLQLADTLMYFYQRMYGVTSAVPGAIASTRSRIVSVQPNPIVSNTTISYVVAPGDEVAIDIYDSRGIRVTHFTDTEAGERSHRWNGVDDGGARLANGNYFIRMTSASGSSEMRVVLQR